jgi:hypothetical protein
MQIYEVMSFRHNGIRKRLSIPKYKEYCIKDTGYTVIML